MDRALVADRLMPGLATVAAALNANDQGLARIAAVHLQNSRSAQPSRARRHGGGGRPHQIRAGRRRGRATGIRRCIRAPARRPIPAGSHRRRAQGDASSPIRTAQNDNPPRRLDFLPGSALPGDPFPSADEAAVSALLLAFALARSAKLEYAGQNISECRRHFLVYSAPNFVTALAGHSQQRLLFRQQLTGKMRRVERSPWVAITPTRSNRMKIKPSFRWSDKLVYTDREASRLSSRGRSAGCRQNLTVYARRYDLQRQDPGARNNRCVWVV